MSDEIPFLDHLGEQLRGAKVPPPRRTPLVVRAAVAVAVVALVAIGINAVRPDRVEAGITVDRNAQRVSFRIVGQAPPASAIEAVAKRNGINLVVEEVPVTPSLVGQLFTGSIYLPSGVSEAMSGSPIELDDDSISFPVNWALRAEIQIGRAAKAGEDYAHSADAFSDRREVFGCLGLRGASPRQLQEVAERRHVEISWQLFDAPNGVVLQPTTAADVLTGAHRSWRVSRAEALRPGLVRAWVTPELVTFGSTTIRDPRC